MAKVCAELLNDFRAPTLQLLTGQNLFPDLPIEQHEFLVHGYCRPYLRRLNPALQTRQQILVTLRS